MAQLIIQSLESQPTLELRGHDASGAPMRMVVCTGQLDVCADRAEGPARTVGVVRFLVPGSPTLPPSFDLAAARVAVVVHPLGVMPIAMNDARALVNGARAAFVADGRGGTSLGVEMSLEGLYLTPPGAMRLAYQVTATIPDA